MRSCIIYSLIVFAMCGCNALDDRPKSGAELIIPTDERPVHKALRTPPPISGGTLAVSPDGAFAVAADPDRDRISIVTLATAEVRHIALEPGDEPGRVIVSANGIAHVALRGAGALARVDLQTATLRQSERLCGAPRGLARDPATDRVHVACADGWLVSVDSHGAIAARIEVGRDLRDVVVQGDRLLLSTYKSAELLTVSAGGAVSPFGAPPKVDVFVAPRAPVFVDGQPTPLPSQSELRTMQPHLAWRAIAGPDNTVVMLHQQESESMVDIDQEPTAENASPYGGGTCEGIVQSNVTMFDLAGGARQLTIGGAVLAVDMAMSAQDGAIAVALPGAADLEAPRPTVVQHPEGGGFATGGFAAPPLGNVVYIDPAIIGSSTPPGFMGCQFTSAVHVNGQATAVAFTPSNELVVQTREPAKLVVVHQPPFGFQREIALGGDSVRDTGHDIFHRDAGAGIACASCHGEGGDDGHTWLFSGIGARRTQAVHVGLEGTAPFHWDGDMDDLSTLMEEVFVGRMGGVHQSGERLDALAEWMFALEPPAPMVDPHDPAALRGKELFESADVGCAGCHSGAALTNNASYDVGTGERGELLQVPALRGVGYRAPFIHNGCAETLRDRFDPACGGAEHGNTAHLGDHEIDDLIAYLRSL